MLWVLYGAPGGPYHRGAAYERCPDCPEDATLFSPAGRDIESNMLCPRCAPDSIALAESFRGRNLRQFGPADTMVCITTSARWTRRHQMTPSSVSLSSIDMTGRGAGCTILVTLRSWSAVVVVPATAVPSAESQDHTFPAAVFCVVPSALADWLFDLKARTVRHQAHAATEHFTASVWTVATLPGIANHDELADAARIAMALWEPDGPGPASDPHAVMLTALSLCRAN